jgi:hypothetical protein
MNTIVIIVVALVVVAVGVWYFFMSSGPLFVLDSVTNSYAIKLNNKWYIFDQHRRFPSRGYADLFDSLTISNTPSIKLPVDPNREGISFTHIIPTSSTSKTPALLVHNDSKHGWQLYPITSQSVYSAYKFKGTYLNHDYSTLTSNVWSKNPPPMLSTTPL